MFVPMLELPNNEAYINLATIAFIKIVSDPDQPLAVGVRFSGRNNAGYDMTIFGEDAQRLLNYLRAHKVEVA